MVEFSQDTRAIQVVCADSDTLFLFKSMHGTERLSTLFEYRVELLSTNAELDLDKMLGTDMCLSLQQAHCDPRYFHGFVSDCAHLGGQDEFAIYSFTLRPWLWFLTQTTDCRIFQDQSVPEIIEQILQEEGFSDITNSLTSSYTKRHYCVQYQETDFAFLSRLMEEEGIYYFFSHENGKHNMVLADGASAHSYTSASGSIKYISQQDKQLDEPEYFSTWLLRKRVCPGRVVLNDFNFVKPGDSMLASSDGLASHAHSDHEIYDYSAEYPSQDTGEKIKAHGDRVVRTRMESLQATHELVEGGGEISSVGAGDMFILEGCDRADQNRDYIVVESEFDVSLGSYVSGDSNRGTAFTNRIVSIPLSITFRAPNDTPKPYIQGPQTAIVVGKSGEEIWTDKYGSVKLQFHWDRYGKSDEKSSCWVRVSQAWAGTKFGSIHIPRINQEVIVEYINGDPDQPIITGRVYNGDNKVPYDLPSNATQSGIKSRSSKGGTAKNFNEIRMEDKKDKEELYIHAERNHTNITEADRSESVGHDRSLSVGNDKSETIDNDKKITVKGKHDETITSDTTITVKEGNYILDIQKGTATTTVKKKALHTYKDEAESVATKVMKLESKEKIVLLSGESSITLDKDGTITIKGKEIIIDGSTSVLTTSAGTNTVHADADATLEGKNVGVGADTKVNIEGSSTVNIEGGTVTVN